MEKILFKNVDICDLESIFQKGILPLNSLEKNNWDCGKRADNPTDVVYMFSPIGEQNSFPKYGVALLEVFTTDAVQNNMSENDSHKNDYKEYVVDKIVPHQIQKIYIPRIFKNRLNHLTSEILNKITWVEMEADFYKDIDDKLILTRADAETLEIFAETAEFERACYNFFRGTFSNRRILDLYKIKYII